MKRRRPTSGAPGGMDRRSFLANAAAASAAAALAPRVLSASNVQNAVTWASTPCRLCGVGCGLLVGVQEGRAVAVKADREHPVNQGLACVKGYYAVQALYARDRITRAMVRRDGVVSPTPMRDALTLVSTRIRDTLARYGPDSVALYGSAQWSAVDALVAARLFRGAIGTRNVDTSARLHGAAAEFGAFTTYGEVGPPGTYEDLDHADVFVLWDVNMAETDPVLFSRILERRRTNPAVRIIDLATRTTRTSYAADRALLYAPESTLAIANAICHEIIARHTANRDFVTRYVGFRQSRLDPAVAEPGGLLVPENEEEVNWEAFESFLAEYTPERAQRVSALDAASIRWLASLYADPARRVVSLWGAGVDRQHHGLWVNNALHNIHLLVGKVASPGNAALPVSTPPGGTALLADVMGHRAIADESERRRRAALWGVDVSKVDSRQARPVHAIFHALERGDIRFLWIQATNPMRSMPNADRLRAAARRGAFIVVSDAYPTATTDVADVVLPTAIWFEREGIMVNGERRIQRTERLVAPPGDSMSDVQQLLEVAQRLGHQALVPWNAARVVEQGWPTIRGADPEAALPDFAALRSGALWPAPGGRATRWRYNSAHDPRTDRSRTFDFPGHADRRAWIWLRPWKPATSAPDQEFPFWLSTGSVVEHWGTGTLTRRIPTLHRAVPASYVELHRDDARELGIRDRDIVRLTSRRGSVELEARIDYRGQPTRRRLFAPSFDEDAALNLLMTEEACAASGQIASASCAVRIDRVRSGA